MKCLLAIGIGLAASTATASVDLIAHSRYISSNEYDFTTTPPTLHTLVDGTSDVGVWSGEYTYSRQQGSIHGTYMSANGMATGHPGSVMNPYSEFGRSYLTVVFSVPYEQTFTFYGSLGGSSVNPIPTVSAFLSLTGPGFNIDRRSYLEPGSFSYGGTIGPGEYTLILDARVDELEGPGNAQPATWDFYFRAVPTPSALALIACGTLFAARRRRE